MDMSKKVTTVTTGRHGRNVASRGVAGGPLRSRGPREAASAAREPLGTEYGVGAQGSMRSKSATMPRFCREAKIGSRWKVRSAERLEKDEQGLAGGAKKMTLQREPKGIASRRCLNIAGVMTLPTVEGHQGDCGRKTSRPLAVCQ